MTDDLTIRVVDTETTGLDFEADRVCELGTVDLVGADKLWRLMAAREELINPGIPMSPEARAVHHISDDDLKDADAIEKVAPKFLSAYPRPVAYAAHNAAFEQGFLSQYLGAVPVIDTWKVALRLWPNAPRHTNQVLRYWLKIEIPAKHPTQPPHRALPDAVVTAHILIAALQLASIEQMIAWSGEPPLLPRCPIGKEWRDQPWDVVDGGFLDWILGVEDMDPDIQWNAQRELDRRERALSADERDTYVKAAIEVVNLALDVDSLRQWWIDEAETRKQLGIIPADEDGQKIAQACIDRKTLLLQQQPKAEDADAA